MEFQVENFTCVCDDEDWEWMQDGVLSIHKRKDQPHKYLLINGVMAHKLIFARANKILKRSQVIDHINRNALDNRRCNLRALTNYENLYLNKRKRGGSSLFIGVSKDKKSKKWRSQVTTSGINTYLGLFETEREAALAHDIYLLQCKTNPLRLNFPDAVTVLKGIINARH